MMLLAAACDLFLDHLQVERNLSPHTLAAYSRDLQQLRAFLVEAGSITCVAEVDAPLLSAWLQHLGEQGRKPASVARARAAMRQLFVFLQRRQLRPDNPAAACRGPRPRRPLPKVISAAEAERLMDGPGNGSGDAPGDGASPRALRDRAALELLYGSGLRASELCRLPMEQVNLVGGYLRPRGKGDKERVVPMSGPAVAALALYLERGRPHLLPAGGSPFVFIGNRGQALSRMGLYKIVRRRALGSGVAHPTSPHALRHAFATHLLRGGADLRVVQELLGHASIATTEIYTQVAQDELRDVVDQHHPLGDPVRREPK